VSLLSSMPSTSIEPATDAQDGRNVIGNLRPTISAGAARDVTRQVLPPSRGIPGHDCVGAVTRLDYSFQNVAHMR
jgi:hypothetical protein